MKTASELALEYWNKPPIERVNNTIQDYVYDYMIGLLNVEKRKMEMAKDYLTNTNHNYFHFKYEMNNILTSGTYYKNCVHTKQSYDELKNLIFNAK